MLVHVCSLHTYIMCPYVCIYVLIGLLTYRHLLKRLVLRALIRETKVPSGLSIVTLLSLHYELLTCCYLT